MLRYEERLDQFREHLDRRLDAINDRIKEGD
jgi:hypothetical protein